MELFSAGERVRRDEDPHIGSYLEALLQSRAIRAPVGLAPRTMTEKNRDGMQVQVLSKEKAKVLAEQYGWSPEFAEGYVDGEAWRRRRRTLPEHTSVGIDEYSQGFRAAYFNRRPGPEGNFEKRRPGPKGNFEKGS